MANEFVARKGIIVLANGAKVTGSIEANGAVSASAGFSGSGANIFGVVSSSYATTSSLALNNVTNATVDVNTITFTRGDGTTFDVVISQSGSVESASFATIAQTANTASYVEYNNVANKPTLVSASSQVNHDSTTGFVANEHIDHSTVNISAGLGLTGGGDITATRTLTVDTGSAHFTGGTRKTITSSNTTGASGINLNYNQTTGNISASLVNSSVTVNGQSISLGGSGTVTANTTNALTLGAGLTGTSFNGGTAVTTTVDTGSAHFTSGVKAKLNADSVVSSSAQVTSLLPTGTVSASSQVVASQITGIGAYATTGSNTFTGIQTVSNTTNSTDFTNGAVIIQGGLGVAKDVNISGSVNISGLLTVVSMSTQYVTSSQLTVGTSRVVVNDDDNVRFAGLSVVDSGSTSATGSILWDSLKNHWVYEREDGGPYRSAVVIAGPKNYGTLGDEEELISGRVPVATGGDHIDTNIASSSIRIDLPSRLTHIEAGLYVTGAISSSVGFSGNGAGLTNVVASSVDYANVLNKPTLVSASSQIDHDATTNFVANEHIDHSTVNITAGAGLSGGGNITATRTLSVNSGSMLPYYSSSIFGTVSGDITITAAGVATIAANSVALGTDTTGNYAASVAASNNGIVVGGTAGEGTAFTVALDTGSTTFSTGVKTRLNAETVVSSSGQVAALLPAGTVSSSLQFNNLSSPFTGSFTGSFTGDGSGLTGLATTLRVTGSASGTGTVNLLTQGLIVSGTNGLTSTVSGQTVTISGSDATTTTKGVASFNSTNFTVTNGAVTSNNISINGTNVTLGGTRNITLQEITTQGATTTTATTFSTSATINNTLYSGSATTGIVGPVSNQVVASIPTGSFDAVHFDYVVKDGTNFRTGTVMAIRNTAGTVEYTDTSTNDIGNTTGANFEVDVNTGNFRLKFSVSTGTWTVKTAIRAL
jgi:hypothetical protein